ncbi:MAG TPA: HAD-IA family hydrolase [Candidatus Saccharimonadales bacterium]|nr:HAD-IA family hydrolase [Candidatus Saccharimonadales bacterium]
MIRAVLFDYGRVLSGPLWPHFTVRRLAKKIKASGLKIGILSNIFLAAAIVFKLTGGYRGFDPIILSFKEKVAKPNAPIYEIAIKRLGVKPEEILFIDNLEVNIAAAKSLGMKTILAKSSKQVVRDIKEVLLKENKLDL